MPSQQLIKNTVTTDHSHKTAGFTGQRKYSTRKHTRSPVHVRHTRRQCHSQIYTAQQQYEQRCQLMPQQSAVKLKRILVPSDCRRTIYIWLDEQLRRRAVTSCPTLQTTATAECCDSADYQVKATVCAGCMDYLQRIKKHHPTITKKLPCNCRHTPLTSRHFAFELKPTKAHVS